MNARVALPERRERRRLMIAAAHTALVGLFPARQPALDESYEVSLAALSAACEHSVQSDRRRRSCGQSLAIADSNRLFAVLNIAMATVWARQSPSTSMNIP